jgi:DNA repair protein RadD
MYSLFCEPMDAGVSTHRHLRAYQQKAVDETLSALKEHNRVILQLPTGAGKTRVAAELIRQFCGDDGQALFTVPFTVLIEQTAESFRRDGLYDLGFIWSSLPTDPHAQIQIASVQTLIRRTIPPPSLILIDEAHRRFKSLDALLTGRFSGIPVIGLTATPWSKGLGKIFGKLVIGERPGSLRSQGFLCGYTAYCPQSLPNLTKVKITAGDYKSDEISEIMQSRTIAGSIIPFWKEKAHGLPTVAYTVDLSHARSLLNEFLEAGIAAEYMDGMTPWSEREPIIKRFESKKTQVLVNCDVLSTGFDSAVHCIIDACPTASQIRFVQRIGRALRPKPDGSDAIILDHAGNHLRHGYVWDITHTKLNMGDTPEVKATVKKKGIAQCPQCGAVIKGGDCKECGFTFYKPPHNLHVTDDKLVKYGTHTHPARDKDDYKEWIASLKAIAINKGYKPGWVYFKFREKFGKSPPFPVASVVPSKTPADFVVSFIISQNIRWRKSRGTAKE